MVKGYGIRKGEGINLRIGINRGTCDVPQIRMINKDIYIKKIGRRGRIDIWLVDGAKIRRDLDVEFTNFSHHYIFKFIPENEFWIDKEHNKGERRYYIDHMLIEHRLMAEGKNEDYAIDKADIVERRERTKSKFVAMGIDGKITEEEIIKKIHKELFKEYSKKVNVWIVNGEVVRGLFYTGLLNRTQIIIKFTILLI